MPRCVIVGGADIQNYENAKSRLRSDDFFVYCDCGLRHLDGLGRRADLVVGDFDSHEPPDFPVETIILPRKKDDTDTGYALKEALRRGYEDILLMGVIGNRLDHSLGNVALLLLLREKGLTGAIVDDYSEISLIGEGETLVTGECAYFSLVNLFGNAGDISIEHAKFPLDHGTIPPGDTLGISNEPLPGQTPRILVGHGVLLLIKIPYGNEC